MKSESHCPQIGHLAARVCVCGRHIIPSREGHQKGFNTGNSTECCRGSSCCSWFGLETPVPVLPPGRRRTESLLGFPTVGRKDNLKQTHFVKNPTDPLIHLQELLLGSGSPLRALLSFRDRSVIAKAAP